MTVAPAPRPKMKKRAPSKQQNRIRAMTTTAMIMIRCWDLSSFMGLFYNGSAQIHWPAGQGIDTALSHGREESHSSATAFAVVLHLLALPWAEVKKCIVAAPEIVISGAFSVL